VTRPTCPPDPDSLQIARRLQTDLGGGLLLLGFDPPPAEVNAGDRLPLTLFWQALAAPADDYTARLSLVAPNGTVVAEERATPGRASHPTSAWAAGDVVRDGRSPLVPAATPAGEYALRVDLLDAAGQPLSLPSSQEGAEGVKPADLLSVTVHAPQRSFDLPPLQHPFSATLDHQAVLLGYDLDSDLPAPGQPFTLTLFWQAEATAEVGYVAFVHLLDQAERIHAQSDRVPAAGTRPTTGWLPGEVIRDAHTLTLAPDAPPGRYVLEVGMYDPASGERLRVFDEDGDHAGDHILLPTAIQVR
jgi:hypothetical protein